ncbi:hypothetical protein [Staphylococcus massiliensis]|uniref:Uncharacterized protein n=1 Tax=Staphylococcus massiliensis S46 TaxID=1229783 RepID=K9AW58_9STAP|nr:hypothetical protein [Staphylococcus massiliensis]EKU45735.1 hypothetical protein C273_10817 [Staphylococcus massiliensis S46]MCG3400413.1 hypothetical protein [Staphylococcus massiliensis]MCG3401742.1 hypothetical protein [Staphylococcus massiliensis]MCG3413484.1 hypothetical protein [Staphylococcus massiliensis]PNZ97681.1 hypothetical protein CD133_10265 [Staphylococcus massiliensis CCUG 55927]
MQLISAIGSIGTFIMALFYLISVSIQLYQLRINFMPALGFNQILLFRNGSGMTLRNTTEDSKHDKEEDFIKLYNLGGGAAKEIKISISIGKERELQNKYVSILPSKEGYLLPINEEVFNELERTIQDNGYESNLNIHITYKHSVSRKVQHTHLVGKIDMFRSHKQETIYELQFIQSS